MPPQDLQQDEGIASFTPTRRQENNLDDGIESFTPAPSKTATTTPTEKPPAFGFMSDADWQKLSPQERIQHGLTFAKGMIERTFFPGLNRVPSGQAVLESPVRGAAQAATGAIQLGKWEPGTRLSAGLDVVEGAMQAGTGWLAKALHATPLPTIRALVAGVGAQQAVEFVGRVTGANSTFTRLASDIAGVTVGGVAEHRMSGAARARETPFPDVSDMGEAKPSEPITSAKTTAAPSKAEKAHSEPQTSLDFEHDPGIESFTPAPATRTSGSANDRVDTAWRAAAAKTTMPEGSAEKLAPSVDTLDTGEAQPRLPGETGAVRDQEVAQPAVAEVPPQSFDLKETPSTKPKQAELLATPRAKAFKELTPEVQNEVRRIHAELEENKFQRGVSNAGGDNDLADRRGAGWSESSAARASYESQESHPNLLRHTANAPVFHDIMQGKGGSAQALRTILKKYVDGGQPTARVQRAIEVAEKRLGLRPLEAGEKLAKAVLPPEAGEAPLSEWPLPDRARQVIGARLTGYGRTPEDIRAIFDTPEYAESVGIVERAMQSGEHSAQDIHAMLEAAGDAVHEAHGGDIQELYGGMGLPGRLKLPPLPQWAKDLSGWLNPAGVSETAARTKDVLRNPFADIANAEDIRRVNSAAANRWFGRQTDAENTRNLGMFERTGTFLDRRLADYSRLFQDSMDQAHEWLTKAFGDDVVGYIEHYVRHAFRFGSKADAEKAASILQGRIKGSLSANKSVLKRRALRIPVDEALDVMRKAGIKVEMVTTNPEQLRQWALNNAYRAMRFKELGDTLNNEGLIRFAKTGKEATMRSHDLYPLDDHRFQVYFRAPQGLVKAGQYYATAPVKRLMDRAISRGWSDNKYFRGIRTVNAVANQLTLALPGFHAKTTMFNMITNDVALAVKQGAFAASELARGQVGSAVKAAGRATVSTSRAATIMGSTARAMVQGRAFQKAIRASNPAALDFLRTVMNPAGGRLGMSREYASGMREQFSHAISNSQYGKATLKALPGLADWASAWLMEQTIPSVKVGAFIDLANEIKLQHPTATRPQLDRLYGKGWDSIDNRVGLLTYQNLVWGALAVQMGQLMIRSMGWNHGTEQELGGGAVDAARFLKTGKVSDRLAFTVALPLTHALASGVYQWARTQTWPKTLKDYFAPQDGEMDASGNPSRTLNKDYLLDAVNFARDPKGTVLHKIAPLPEYVRGVLQNRNFFDDMVRNPNDPIAIQLWQEGKYALQTLGVPIALSQIAEEVQQNVPMNLAVERGFGFQKAPAWVTQGATQQAATDQVYGKRPRVPRTPEQVATDTLKAQARRELLVVQSAEDPTPAFQALIDQGVFPTQAVAKKFESDAHLTPYQRVLFRLSLKKKSGEVVDTDYLKQQITKGMLTAPAQIDRFLALFGFGSGK